MVSEEELRSWTEISGLSVPGLVIRKFLGEIRSLENDLRVETEPK